MVSLGCFLRACVGDSLRSETSMFSIASTVSTCPGLKWKCLFWLPDALIALTSQSAVGIKSTIRMQLLPRG